MLVPPNYVKERAEREWNSMHSHGPFAWLFRHLGAMKPISTVWICQHCDGDWDKARCKGDPERVWRLDANGLAPVEHLPELDISNAIASTTPVISFCLDNAAERMIYQEWKGPRAGFGGILVLKKSGEWATQKHAWIS